MSALCSFGQVGIGTTSDVLSPIELKALRSQGVKFVACGDEHTALLTQVSFWFGRAKNGCGCWSCSELVHGKKIHARVCTDFESYVLTSYL